MNEELQLYDQLEILSRLYYKELELSASIKSCEQAIAALQTNIKKQSKTPVGASPLSQKNLEEQEEKLRQRKAELESHQNQWMTEREKFFKIIKPLDASSLYLIRHHILDNEFDFLNHLQWFIPKPPNDDTLPPPSPPPITPVYILKNGFWNYGKLYELRDLVEMLKMLSGDPILFRVGLSCREKLTALYSSDPELCIEELGFRVGKP